MKSNRRIEHFVADVEETPLVATDSAVSDAAPASLWADAWRNLRRRPLFIVSALLILLVLAVSLFPQWFSQVDPASCSLSNSLVGPGDGHPLGYNFQGCDIYSRMIYGAQASVSVGILATLGVVLIGGTLGALAGYYGGFLDSVIARLVDIVFALPLVLGALVVMQSPLFRDNRTVWTVAMILAVFGWPSIARITRAATLEIRNADFVVAARSLGVSPFGALIRHVVPNAIAPVIVIATVSLGTFIVAEATLSFLGIGLPTSVMSWGNDISTAQASIRTNPEILIYPAVALSITVLSFIMLGDAVRDALDPKARKR
ncbi:ABC transporter permease [Arthrobacter russicus]|jgi:oligopeptide transport system permease protein|uniref:Oligopeptide transport system permease protein n=1 Tax=Arthrobacter russicus TaxID=172040 RepID=A0ABU1JCK4_9MICC|nr:ABC transporter permease [Arthrobacter russicus]MDN5666956.1 ABC transporter permease [Renibacterium salmoninarum]MDR6269879.1 oligopeptide transport system permease protein [Arthrobacter russicus]